MDYRNTKEENETLTRVGRGTPGGEFLRRYWWPVTVSDHLKDKPTFIRLLGEDLVLFRDSHGKPGLLAAKCSHRRANLCLGSVEEKGLRCRYHGWLYDREGSLLETPGEPDASGLKERVHQTAYPAQELGNLIFAYLGPKPIPLLPRFHFLAAEGYRHAIVQGFGNCNWLQTTENGIDPLHTTYLHGDIWSAASAEPVETWIEQTDWGVVYKSVRKGRKEGEYNYREHHLFMPSISSGGDASNSEGADNPGPDELPAVTARWGVPIDDTHMMHIRVFYKPFNKEEKGIKFTTTSLAQTRTAPYQLEVYGEYKKSDNPVFGLGGPPFHWRRRRGYSGQHRSHRRSGKRESHGRGPEYQDAAGDVPEGD